MVSPPIDPVHRQRYFGDLKVFEAVDELVMIVTPGVPGNAVAAEEDLERALQYENYSSIAEHVPPIWEKIGEDVRQKKCSV